MNDVVKYEEVKDRIIVLRGEPVLLDADLRSKKRPLLRK